jgi:hypothetical protein
MTEVGGGAAGYFRPLVAEADRAKWAREAAEVLDSVLQEHDEARRNWVERGLENVQRFEPAKILCEYETVYRRVLNKECGI